MAGPQTPHRRPPDHLTPEQVGRLLARLQEFHRQQGMVGTVLDPAQEKRVIEGFRRFLAAFLGELPGTDKAAEQLAGECFAGEIPFVSLMGSFNYIKEHLILMVASNTPDPMNHYRRIDAVFERAKRVTAHHYLRHEAKRSLPMPAIFVRDKILIRVYREWFEQLRTALAGDLDAFPLEPAEDCPFARALRYPESLLVCLDLKICDQILEHHRSIFQQASILYAVIRAGRYEQAYILYKEIYEKITQLFNLLSVLYFEGQTNRVGRFFNFVQAALHLPGRKYFCVLNLSQMNRINRLYGTETGDRALEAVEAALRRAVDPHRSWLLFTRGIAGDFYLFGIHTDPDRMCRVLEGVREEIGQHTDLPEELDLLYHGVELTEFRQLTTENMHLVVQYLAEQSRRAGPDPCPVGDRHHEDAMLAWIKEQYRRTLDLRAKLTDETVEIFVQPLVTLDERREIHAFEVLGRFREGDGFLSAGLFIDDIIAMGLITDFDRLILRALARQARELREITKRLFVNVSAVSLADPAYLDDLGRALDGPLKAFEVVLELTEQVLFNCRDQVHALHEERGVLFAIDDFGTGYSSLRTVIELATEGSVRYLKLDGSLTESILTHPASEHIVRITQRMARELGLDTVAEYIETPEQQETLERLRIDLGQGFLIGIPDPVPVWKGKMNYLRSSRRADTSLKFAY